MPHKKETLLSALFAVMLLLSACSQRQEIPPHATPMQEDTAQNQQDTTSTASDLYQEELNRMAQIYEKYQFGLDFSYVQENNDFYFFVCRYLEAQGLAEEFIAEDSIMLPAPLVNQFLGLLFEKDAFTPQEDYPYVCSLGFSPEKVELNTFEVNTTMDADSSLAEVTVLYGRFAPLPNGQKQWLYPVQYTFKPYTVTQEDIPELANFPYQAGDTRYRLVNVVNITSKEQAREIYTQYGFGELFEEKSYTLSTPAELLQMAERVNSGVPGEIDATYTLANDIDMAGVDFTPIGSNVSPLETDNRNPHRSGFCGRLEGSGFAISNLSFHATTFEENATTSLGMFAVVGSGAVVRNLELDNATFTFEESNLPLLHTVSAGLLAGQMRGGTVEQCHVSGKVSGSSSVGGLIGNATADFLLDGNNPSPSFISGCTSDATVIGWDSVGGLVGTNHYTHIGNSRATGIVLSQNIPASPEMPRNIGGFAGLNVAGSIVDSFCDTEVKTAVPSACVGMFAGLNEGDISSCFYHQERGGTWKGIGDSPRAEWMADATGLSNAAYNEQAIAMPAKESNGK